MTSAEHFASMGMISGGPPSRADLDAIVGCDVLDADGVRVGTVVDVYVDRPGEPRYLAIETGWFGTRWAIVPLDGTGIAERDGRVAIIVPYAADRLRRGPAIGVGEEVTTRHEGDIHRHYGRPGYWEVVDARQSTPAPTPEVARADEAARGDEARRAGDVPTRQTPPAPTPRVAEAEVEDAIARGESPDVIRVRRWRA